MSKEPKVIHSPLAVYLPRKTKEDRKMILNLNNYRNWQHFLSNNTKKAYKEVIAPQLEGLRFATPISLTFTLWQASKRRIDRLNVLSIHDKFLLDAMTELGCIEDDNDDYVKETTYRTGGIDRENPRVDVEIFENL